MKSPRELLIYWIDERLSILASKEAYEPAPWSEDPIFQSTYFCNVMREDDKVTKWIREHWNKPDDPHYAQAMCLARFVNKPSTLTHIGYPYVWRPDLFIATMNNIEHPWGGAYIVSTNGRKMPKAEYIAELITSYLSIDLTIPKASTCLATFKRLTALNGIGSFMAGQVIADLKNTIGHPLNKASDWWTWSTHGPGSLRGLGWYFGKKITPSMYNAAMTVLRAEVENEISIPLHNQDLQNCLCEYDKYMRILNGTGRSKRRYNGYGT